jgi:hypothetical protein
MACERQEKECKERKEAERKTKFIREHLTLETRDKVDDKLDYERMHCFYCGEQGSLTYFHSKYFHKKCLNKFKNTDNGKKWIIEEKKFEMFTEKIDQIVTMMVIYKNINNCTDLNESDLLAEFTRSEKGTDEYYEKIWNINLDEFLPYLERTTANLRKSRIYLILDDSLNVEKIISS